MSVLVDWEIREAIASGALKIDPFEDSLVNPCSLDYRLGTKFGYVINPNNTPKVQYPIDPTDSSTFVTKYVDCSTYRLNPKQFVIAASLESLTLPNNISAYTLGKSSLGRLGLQSSTSFAGWIDCGFSCKHLTLELFNSSDNVIILTSGMKIGQYIFLRHSISDKPYGSPGVGRYQGQEGGEGSKGI